MSFGIPVRNGLAIGLLSSTTLSSNGGLFPAMFLDFLQPFLDSRITFSRGSNATLVDSTGKITYAPANLVLQSEALATSPWALTNATYSSFKLIENTASSAHQSRQQITVVSGNKYIVSAYVAPAERRVVLRLRDSLVTGREAYVIFDPSTGLSTASGGTTWTATALPSVATANGYRVAMSVVVDVSGSVAVDIGLADSSNALVYAGDGTSGVFVQQVQAEPVTYQTTPGTYNATTSAAYYGPRFDYDPVTLAPKGLLIEEQRVNLVTYSDQFDNAAWGKANATVTANATMSPDGTVNADLITQTLASPAVFQGPILTAAPYTASIRFKQGTAAGFELIFGTSGLALGVRLTYTFATNTTVVTLGGAPTGVSTSVTAIGNGWYEARITVTATATIWFFDPHPVGTNGQTVFVWGAQLEAGAFATSYIPTVASQVTRSADALIMTGTNFSSWYNATQSTFVVSADVGSVGSGDKYLLLVNDANGRVAYVNTASINTFDGTTVTSSGQSAVANTPFNVATAWSGSTLSISAKGAAAVNGAFDGTMGIGTELRIGMYIAGSAGAINGHIRSIAYYNTRLPNATLQSLTA